MYRDLKRWILQPSRAALRLTLSEGTGVALFKRHRSEAMSLQDAVSQGLVRVELRGVAAKDPSRVRLSVHKLVDRPLTIEVPRGSRFTPTGRGDDHG